MISCPYSPVRRDEVISNLGSMCIERMRPEQIHQCRKKADVAFLPLGALEWHGLHNSIATDAVKSHYICCLAAGKLGGGAVFPPLVWGVPRDSFFVETGLAADNLIPAAFGTEPEKVQGFASHGGMDIQEQWLFYQKLLRMCLEHISGFGFRSVYICAGHNKLGHWMRPVAAAFTRASNMSGQLVTVDWGNEYDAAGMSGDHGGKWETSLMMAADSESVDLRRLEERPEYLGIGSGKNAVESTKAQGEKWAESCAEAIAREARWLVDNYPKLPPRHGGYR